MAKRFPGFIYVILAVTGFYTMHAFGKLYLPEVSSGEWISLLQTNMFLYKSGLASLFFMNISWLWLACIFFERFRSKNRRLAWYLLLSVIAGSSVVFGIFLMRSVPLMVLSQKPELNPETYAQWMTQARFFFTAAARGDRAASFFYALWLFPLSLLFLKLKGIRPKVRVLLFSVIFICGMGYLADFFIYLILPIHATFSVTDYTFWGEVILLIWLLAKGLETDKEGAAQ